MYRKGNRWILKILCGVLSVTLMGPSAAFASIDEEQRYEVSENTMEEAEQTAEERTENQENASEEEPGTDTDSEKDTPKEPDTGDPTEDGYIEGWIIDEGKKHWQYTDGSYACNTWIEDEGKKYYLDESGNLTTGWKKLQDGEYFFLEDGSLAVNQWIDKVYVDSNGRRDDTVTWHEPGWKHNSVGWWWQNEDGTYPSACFERINNQSYYFDKNGYMVTGWLLIQNHWYYFKNSGAMATGWQKIRGYWYYLDESGIMRTGWQQIRGTWYYLRGSGAMQTGWLRSGSTWYYLNGSGAMVTGWQKIGGTWYYLKDSGAMSIGWLKDGNHWYYLKNSGAMATGWLKVGNSWYYLNGSGAMAVGWVHIHGVWYYLSNSGAMVTGWQKINDKWYYFRENGAMAADTWVGSYYLTNSGAWDPDVLYDNRYTWPCPGYTRISSDYGPRPRPTAGASSYHKGIDIAAPAGTVVTAIHRGKIQGYGYNGTMGNYVKIDHGNGVVSIYMHMSRIGNIYTGMQVSAGTTIGYVGSTGVATGAHLHLATLLNGTYVSPWNYLDRP